MQLDALNRRNRFAKPQPLKARLEITERDLLIFEAIARHGKLPTNYIYELTKHKGKDYTFLQKRLTQLYNGLCTHPEHKFKKFDLEHTFEHKCEGKGYVTRDFQQFNNLQARYQPIIYGLTDLAWEIFKDRSLPRSRDPFLHQFMQACVTASIELNCMPITNGPRFISPEEILAKAPAMVRQQKILLSIPVHDDEIGHIVPDYLFGLEYPEGGYRFFALEVDRNTESIAPTKRSKNNIAKKVRGYDDILSNATYKSHLLIPNLTVLFATTNETHMHNMIEHVRTNSSKPHKYLFKTFEDFGDVWKVPREILPVFEPWQTHEKQFDISKKAPA